MPPALQRVWGTGVSLPALSTVSQLWDRHEQLPSLPGAFSASAHTQPGTRRSRLCLHRKGLEGLSSSSMLTGTPTPLGLCQCVAVPGPQQLKYVTRFQRPCLKEPTSNTSNFRPRNFPRRSQIIRISIMDMFHIDFFYNLLNNM